MRIQPWSPTTAWSLGRLFKMSRPRMRCKMATEERLSDSLCSEDSFIITFSIRTATPKMRLRVYVSWMLYFSNGFPFGTEFKSYNCGSSDQPVFHILCRLQIHCFLSKWSTSLSVFLWLKKTPTDNLKTSRHSERTSHRNLGVPHTPPMPTLPENRASTRPFFGG